MNDSMDKRLYRHYGIQENDQEPKYMRFGFSIGRLKDDKDLVAERPNVIALYLSIADKATEQAVETYTQKIKPSLEETDTHHYLKSAEANSSLFDFFEHAFTAIVFSYSAIEAFANSLIPHNYSSTRKRKEGMIPVDKEWVERNEKLSVKYKSTLLEIYKCDSPASQPFWKDVLLLESIRNEIIHYKSDEPTYNKQVPHVLQDIVFNLFRNDPIGSSRKLMKYMVDQIPDKAGIPYEFREGAFMIGSWDDLDK